MQVYEQDAQTVIKREYCDRIIENILEIGVDTFLRKNGPTALFQDCHQPTGQILVARVDWNGGHPIFEVAVIMDPNAPGQTLRVRPKHKRRVH